MFSVGYFSVVRGGNSGGLPPPDADKLTQLTLGSWNSSAKEVFGGSVDYLEAHGSGSNAGDVAEYAALERVYGSSRTTLLSSVKTYIGHTEAVSGLMAILRVYALFLDNVLSRHLHFQQLNPKLTPSRLIIPVEAVALDPASFSVASISNRGFSGTNVHALMTRGRKNEANVGRLSSHHVFVVSARTQASLQKMLESELIPEHDLSCRVRIRSTFAKQQAAVVSSLHWLSGLSKPVVLSLEHQRKDKNVLILCPGHGWKARFGSLKKIARAESSSHLLLQDEKWQDSER